MNTAQLIVVCLTALAGLVIVAVTASRAIDRVTARAYTARAAAPAQEPQAPPRVNHRVTVHTKKPDDQTIYGVIVGDYTDRLCLEHAEYVTPQGGQPIAGRQDIATRDIAWIDVHGPATKVPDALPAPRDEGART
jgi:hypothetical protein